MDNTTFYSKKQKNPPTAPKKVLIQKNPPTAQSLVEFDIKKTIFDCAKKKSIDNKFKDGDSFIIPKGYGEIKGVSKCTKCGGITFNNKEISCLSGCFHQHKPWEVSTKFIKSLLKFPEVFSQPGVDRLVNSCLSMAAPITNPTKQKSGKGFFRPGKGTNEIKKQKKSTQQLPADLHLQGTVNHNIFRVEKPTSYGNGNLFSRLIYDPLWENSKEDQRNKSEEFATKIARSILPVLKETHPYIGMFKSKFEQAVSQGKSLYLIWNKNIYKSKANMTKHEEKELEKAYDRPGESCTEPLLLVSSEPPEDTYYELIPRNLADDEIAMNHLIQNSTDPVEIKKEEEAVEVTIKKEEINTKEEDNSNSMSDDENEEHAKKEMLLKEHMEEENSLESEIDDLLSAFAENDSSRKEEDELMGILNVNNDDNSRDSEIAYGRRISRKLQIKTNRS